MPNSNHEQPNYILVAELNFGIIRAFGIFWNHSNKQYSQTKDMFNNFA